MNIRVPDSWLREHLKTKAKVAKIAEYLSLCSQSVEKTTKVDDDWVYEIEVTTNRPDCLSVLGIARELAAILPRFKIPAKLKQSTVYSLQSTVKDGLPLEVKIANPSLCPRFTALIFDDINIKPSPKIVQERLEKSGIRALNNVVDISNYLMLELGQPMHTFDYDKIRGAKMILRESAGGEKITTLDGQTRPLPDGAIIIQDDKGRIIDLCGIMGGENSAVDEKTKRVLLFVQTYDPMKIRRTCQLLSFRTEAAQRFEKGVDPQGVILSMEKAIAMFEKNCGAKVASNLIDIYPNPPKQKKIVLSQEKLNQVMGIKIELPEAKKILESLGFVVKLETGNWKLETLVPHWRNGDVTIPEDLIEEIARIYGYHNLPSLLPSGEIPQQKKSFTFVWENKVKEALKFWGFSETFNYSMVSESTLVKAEINPAECLKIANPLSEDWIFMRPSLIPSLLEVVTKNQPETSEIQMFELANVYIPTASDKLPNEILMLSGALTGNQFFQVKGIIEALLAELEITHYNFSPYQLKKTFYGKIFHPFRTAEITIGQDSLGIVGEINPIILARFGIKGRVVVFDLDFNELVKYATTTKKYTPVLKYPAIIEDLAFIVPPKTLVGEMIQLIKSTSLIIQSVELLDSYKDTRTFRITYQSEKKTLSDKEIEKIRKKIIDKVRINFKAKLKQLSIT